MTSEQTPSGRRAALIEHAIEQIAERGMEGFRLREVAEGAGIDHSTLHHYFPRKADLIAAVRTTVTGRLEHTMSGDASVRDPVWALQEHLSGLVTAMGQDPGLFLVLAELELHGRRNPSVGRQLEDDERGWRMALEDLLTRAKGEGRLREAVNPRDTVELVIAAIKGARLAPEHAALALGQLNNVLFKTRSEKEKSS
jgi:AcrR family transcriptional regulator